MIELMRELDLPVHDQDCQQYLTFKLREENYGMSIDSVKEIIPYGNVTAVPLMPGFVMGVLNLRGDVVPIIDLSLRFGKAETEIKPRSCIVILDINFNQETVLLGFVVDSVTEVVDIHEQQIEQPPTFGTKINSEFIHGIINVAGDLFILLQGDQVLSVDEMIGLIKNVIDK
ncbi:chemotaxis protein CheW [Vibrio sp. B1FLJ16]|uniref:chemotaxis protein CheW n=1 Tax=Vibrio sp. B1FLJ16 TaxID=2751178 RepID=UPI0015F73578|nr:chemotaxis protein CheW [Vibrio sp. B1FLJ16]CAD7800307.1 SMART CheW domain protein [Vibrio sp. B1FLJ16]CAE6888258.1 SMART CheW domain protein [Vibrio sp. B1FLJ16]